MGRRISKTSVMIFREMNTISWIGACWHSPVFLVSFWLVPQMARDYIYIYLDLARLASRDIMVDIPQT
jgi:ABC-type phosphate/phosphonate transport system permease subunit